MRMLWLPADEGQLPSMIAQGLPDEGYSLELKGEPPSGKAETTSPSLSLWTSRGSRKGIEQVAVNRNVRR